MGRSWQSYHQVLIFFFFSLEVNYDDDDELKNNKKHQNNLVRLGRRQHNFATTSTSMIKVILLHASRRHLQADVVVHLDAGVHQRL